MRPAADAVLLISSTCPHCSATADALLRLTKEGRVGRAEIINVERHPERAAEVGARALPWLRLGPFELTGAQGYRELADWAERAASGDGWPDYGLRLLAEQRLPEVAALVREEPQRLAALIGLLGDDGLEFGARLGISALVEELAGGPALAAQVPALAALTLSEHPQVRADACHFLGLAGDPSAAPAVRRLLGDEQPDVREIAAETLAVLGVEPEAAP